MFRLPTNIHNSSFPSSPKKREKKKKKNQRTTRRDIRSSPWNDEKSIVDKTDVNAMIKYSRTGNHGRRFLDFAILVTRTGRRRVFKGLKRGNISSSADSLPGNLRFNCPPPWITRQKKRGCPVSESSFILKSEKKERRKRKIGRVGGLLMLSRRGEERFGEKLESKCYTRMLKYAI